MSENIIILRVPEYLQQWMYHDFSNPVELMKDGPESRILNELLRKTPEKEISEETPQCDEETGEKLVDVAVKVPWFKSKDFRVYNYLSNHGKTAMVDSFKTLFKKDLILSVGSLKKVNCKQVTLIYDYMDNHGISEDHWDSVKQIYYRNKKRYLTKNNVKV